jgi:signal transduction histidine kinase
VGRIRALVRRHGVDLLIVVAAIEGALEVLLRDDELRAPRSPAWLAAPAIAAVVLALLARRRYPFAAPAALWVIGAALSFVDGRLLTFTPAALLAGMLAAFLLGNLRDAVQTRVGLALVAGSAAIISYNDPNHAAADLVFTPVLFVIAWLAGFALRQRASQAQAAEQRAAHAEREREAAARLAVAEERARIARELHDVVAHAVSVMVLHVGVVRHRLPAELGEDIEALSGVERTGRAALAEMRHLLGAMRQDSDGVDLTPQPGLDELDALVEQVRRAGLPVRVHLDGERVPLPRWLDLSAYRIVQEGLTNALKHAHASQADVRVHYAPDELAIEVRDDGGGAGATDGFGHGLVGVRERVKLYGGEMSAGTAADGGGFVLATRLPVGEDRR